MTTSEVLLIFGMFLVTFGVRYPVLALVGRATLPEPAVRALKYVPSAVLTAIIVPAVLLTDGRLNLSPTNAYLVGALVAIVVSWRTRNLLWTILIGMGAFLLWRFLTG